MPLWYTDCYDVMTNMGISLPGDTTVPNRKLVALGMAGAAYALRRRNRIADQVKAYRAIGEWDYRHKAGRNRSLTRRLGGYVASTVGRQVRRRLFGR